MSQLLLRSGDYVPDGKGGFCSANEGEEVLQRILLRLTARRGGCPFLPAFGSRLYLLRRAKPGEREALARTYVAEALAEEIDLEITDVTLTETTGGQAKVAVQLLWRGESLTLTVEV